MIVFCYSVEDFSSSGMSSYFWLRGRHFHIMLGDSKSYWILFFKTGFVCHICSIGRRGTTSLLPDRGKNPGSPHILFWYLMVEMGVGDAPHYSWAWWYFQISAWSPLIPQWVGVILFPLDIDLIPPQYLWGWRRRDTSLLLGRSGRPGSHVVSTDTVEDDSLPAMGMKVLTPYLVLPDSSDRAVGGSCYSFMRVDI